MPNLRNSIIAQVLGSLEYGSFCVEDFHVEFPSESSKLAYLTFKALSKYKFVLDETHPGGAIGSLLAATGRNDGRLVIRTIESPGDYKNHEIHIHDDIDSAVNRISKWVSNIRSDLVQSRVTLLTNMDELTNDLHRSIDDNIKDQDSYFEPFEEEDLKSKLDDLQERICDLESKLEISSENIEKIQEVIAKGKSDLKIYPKGVWYKTVGTKLFKIMGGVVKSKEGRELLVDMAKRLLQ